MHSALAPARAAEVGHVERVRRAGLEVGAPPAEAPHAHHRVLAAGHERGEVLRRRAPGAALGLGVRARPPRRISQGPRRIVIVYWKCGGRG